MLGSRNVFGRAVPGAEFQLVSWCAGGHCDIYLVLQAPQEGIVENGALTLICVLLHIHPTPKSFLLYIMALSAFICLPAFPYQPSFIPSDNFRIPSPISLP